MKRVTLFILCVLGPLFSARAQTGLSVSDYGSIQEALDRNPGRVLYVPAGDYVIHDAIRITHAGSGLWGVGRIVQDNADAAIIEIDGLQDARLEGITLTRSPEKMESYKAGISVTNSKGVRVANVQVIDNRSDMGSIYVAGCSAIDIEGCFVKNYSRIAIDDRRKRPDKSDFDLVGGFAFNCINGFGIVVRGAKSTMVRNNRVIETVMIPTRELQAKYRLGKFVAKDATKGTRLSQAMWDEEYINVWHQGSGILIAKPEVDDDVEVIGNYVENAAQGLDIHADHAIIANNIINNAFMGMKAMHGARNVLIIGNQFCRNDLWSIGLMPGTASHEATAQGDGQAARPANIDGGTIIANNIISDFGYGTAHWMWPASGRNEPAPIRLDSAPAPGRPALRDVLIEGNVVYDSGRDQVLVDGKPRVEPPRYHYAVRIGTGDRAPRNLTFVHNLLHAGTLGLSNSQLDISQQDDPQPTNQAGDPLPRRPMPDLVNYEYARESPRQVFDLWKADSPRPTPLVILIHGGGYIRGDKSVYHTNTIKTFLDAGISVAALSYRYLPQALAADMQPPIKAPLEDCARAVQTLRFHAQEWNINPDRIAATGGSAGATTSAWLALHDDMADPNSADPVARQSTRLACIAVSSGPMSIDPAQMRAWIPNSVWGAGAFGYKADGTWDAGSFGRILADRAKLLPWINEYSPILHVSRDDPPVYYWAPKESGNAQPGEPQPDPTHSVIYGLELQKALRAVGVECIVTYPAAPEHSYGSMAAFLIAKLTGKMPTPVPVSRSPNVETGGD